MYSFDVFDTLITRRTATPKGIFALMETVLAKEKHKFDIPSYIRQNFYELRTGAERLARKDAFNRGLGDINLGEIYRALSTVSGLTMQMLEQLQELELELERRNVVGIPENIERVRKLVDEGQRVVLISDMYLGGEQIRRLLLEADPIFEKLPIYASSEYRQTKAGGGLYRKVREAEQAEFSQWIHMGDHEEADIRWAERLGIRTVKAQTTKLTCYEREVLNIREQDSYWQLSVGSSARLRKSMGWGLAGEMGCSLGGPILYPYILWVLEESLRKGIRRLYFVARDGWILKQMADLVLKQMGYPITTKYIYGSRKAWRMASLKEGGEALDSILQWSNADRISSLERLAGIFQLREEEILPFLQGMPERLRRKEGRISPRIREELFRQLKADKSFLAFLVKRHEGARKLAAGYLRQEVDVSDEHFAFVELAGTGLTQACLAHIMDSFYKGRIGSFYLKLDCVNISDSCSYYNFYPSNMDISYMVELLCRAPHGQTEGYELTGERLVPVLERQEGRYMTAYGLEEYRDSLLAYVTEMEKARSRNAYKPGYKLEIIREYMKVIASKPPREVLEYFSRMPFSMDGRSKAMAEFAPPVTGRQVRGAYFWRWDEALEEYYQGSSMEYSVLRTGRASIRLRERCIRLRETKTGQSIRRTAWKLRTRRGLRESYFCPWELLEGIVAVYGAGKVGQAYVRQARKRSAHCREIIWVDSNYQKYQEKGAAVLSPEILKEKHFDRILIAVLDQEVKRQIYERLLNMGIPEGRIYF